MSGRTVVRLAVLLVVVLVVWGALAVVRRPPADAPHRLVIPKLDTAAVDTVVIAKAGDTARLTHTASRQWRENGFPAAPDAIAALLRGLADTTGTSDEVSENRASQPRFGIGPDSGQHVRVVSHSRTVLDLVTGHATSDYGGLYVRPVTDDAVYALHGSLAQALDRPIGDWRDKHIASVTADSVGTIELTRAGRSTTLRRDGHSWRFASGGAADSTAVGSLLGQYRDLNAVGFAAPGAVDTASVAHATRRIRLLSTHGAPLLALRFDSTAARIWARADTGSTIFQLNAWMLPQLVPADSTLRPKATHKH